jgi:hypothetical protein
VTDRDNQNVAKLGLYVPDGTALSLFQFLKSNRVHLKIKKPRSSKLGDYRHPYGKHGHRISVNGNLNKYAFIITLLHEMAHLETWNAHGNKHEPHGIEWKRNFQKVLEPYVNEHVFPDNVLVALNNYIRNPAASSCADVHLARALSSHDAQQETTVETLSLGTLFTLQNNKVFKKGEKLRKRFKCLCISDNRWYYVSPLAVVTSIKQSSEKFV